MEPLDFLVLWDQSTDELSPMDTAGQIKAFGRAVEAAALERAITTIQSDIDAAAELGYERFSRYCAEVVAKLRKLATPVERGGE